MFDNYYEINRMLKDPPWTSLEKKEVQEVLNHFGLRDSDQDVYLALLSLGETTLSPLAAKTSLPLTTVQSILKRLVERGIVRATKHKSRHVYEADEPSVLRRILETQIEEIGAIVPFLQRLKTTSTEPPKVRVYYRDRISDVLHDALKCKSKLVYEVVSAKEFQEVLGEKFHFTRRRMKAGVRLKSLRVEMEEIKKYSQTTHVRELREAKFLPRECTFQSSLLFWDDTVAFFTTKGEGIALVIESKTLREMIFQIFDLLWSVSRRMET